MTALLIALCVLVALAVAALAFIALRSQLAPGPSLYSKTVVINTRDKRSIKGVLVAQHADRVTLREAVYLHGADTEPAIGGLVHIPVSSISWMQEITSDSR